MKKCNDIPFSEIDPQNETLQMLHCSVGFYVGFVSNTMRNALSKMFQDNGYDITHAQWSILMMLWMQDGRQQQELTKMIYKEKTTIARLIDTLEKKDLLVRIPDRLNRRNKHIYLTSKGKDLKYKLTPLVAELNKKASDGLDNEQLDNLKSYLTKIYNNLVG